MSYKHESENLGGEAGRSTVSVFVTVFVVILQLVIELQLHKVVDSGERVHKPTCRIKTNEVNSKRFGTFFHSFIPSFSIPASAQAQVTGVCWSLSLPS